jgi:hypothetical protein
VALSSLFSPTSDLSPSINATSAWTAFDDVVTGTDWRLRLVCVDPLTLTVEHDEDFGDALSGSSSWRTRAQARAWIAARILHLASAIDKTCVRRLCLQLPRSASDDDTTLFLANLRRRITDAIRGELTAHFDTSVAHWEADALRFSNTTEDRELRHQFDAFTGLDQLVSVDAARKAVHFVYFRTHWFLNDQGGRIELKPDHLFANLQSHRCSLDETTRARSLVARCVEVQVEDNARRVASGQDVAPVTRASIHDQIKKRFHLDGVWGLIHLVLVRDRRRYHLDRPLVLDDEADALIQRQGPRLFIPWEG